MDASQDVMMNATLVKSLSPAIETSVNSESSSAPAPVYMDLIKEIHTKNTPATMEMPASIMMQNMPPLHANHDGIMQQFQKQSSAYQASMPQSAPIFQPAPANGLDVVQQTPLNTPLLPDPLFFQPSPPPPPPAAVEEKHPEKSPVRSLSFDTGKIKPAILVAAIVFALLSYGAPLLARRLEWTVDRISGKFTSAGLITISLLTGGIFLGITELIRNFGNGMD